jgi:signal transduction histidine kinase
MCTERVALRPVVEEAWTMFAMAARQAGVSIHDEVPADAALAVLADRKRLKQVLSNLISNAIKYNRAGGRVAVAARDEGSSVLLQVEDSGQGMDDTQLARLFTPFERAGAQHSGIAGTGLGLALARQLAEAMGGSLDAQSTPGQGSVFSLRLSR